MVVGVEYRVYECHLFLLRPVGCYSIELLCVLTPKIKQMNAHKNTHAHTHTQMCTDQSIQYTHILNTWKQ